MVSPAVLVEGLEVGFFFFAREQFPTDLFAGALTVKEATKARLNLMHCGCARTQDSSFLGLGKHRSWRVPCSPCIGCLLKYPTDLHRYKLTPTQTFFSLREKAFSACGYQKKSVVYETECRHVALQKHKQDQNH